MKKILISLLTFALCIPIFAQQSAVVVSARAVIYGDVNMEHAIGYLRRGQKLWVGKVKRKWGQLLPMVTAGRIAYIRTQDIRIEGEKYNAKLKPRHTKRNEFRFKKGDKKDNKELPDDWRDHNQISLHYLQTSLSASSTVPMETMNETSPTATELSINWDHRNPTKWWGYSFGGHYFTQSTETITYHTLALKAGLALIPYRNDLFDFEILTEGLLSNQFLVRVNNFEDYNSFLFGLSPRVQLRFFNKKSVQALIGMGYHYWMTPGLGTIEYPTNNTQDEMSSLSGSFINLGIGFSI